MEIKKKAREKFEDVAEDLKERIDSLKDEIVQIKDRIRSALPAKRDKTSLSVQKGLEDVYDPFRMLQLRTNQIFDDFHKTFSGWDSVTPFKSESPAFFEAGWPRVDLSENDDEIMVKAELPGVNEADIELSLTDESLTIRGEKKVEKEDKGKNYHRLECFQGSFVRTVPVPASVEIDKANASFKKHVLTVKIPKTETAREKGRKIEIKTD
jgi:HSP20 family protein